MTTRTGAAREAQQILTATLTDPPRSGLSTWCAVLAEMWLAAGRPDAPATALDQADLHLRTQGPRYPEGLVLLLRARLETETAARAALDRARTLSLEREAHLFVRRIDSAAAGFHGPIVDEKAAAPEGD